MEQFFTDLCNKIRDFFFKGFGDYKDSFSGDLVLTGTEWQALGSVSKPCKLRLYNTSAADEMQWTPNKDMPIGARVHFQRGEYVDDFIGTAYAKMSDPTKVGTLNYSFIVVATND